VSIICPRNPTRTSHKENHMTTLNLILAVSGCLLYATSLHYQKPQKGIEYGILGFAQNLSPAGRVLFFLGLALAISSFAV
jgi:hypothetical protein